MQPSKTPNVPKRFLIPRPIVSCQARTVEPYRQRKLLRKGSRKNKLTFIALGFVVAFTWSD